MRRNFKWTEEIKQIPDRDTLVWLYKKYVLDCPVPGVSNRGHDFKQLQWAGSKQKKLCRLLMNRSSLTNSTWLALDKKDELINQLASNNVLQAYEVNQEFAYYYKANNSKASGLFYLIRNALAHGSFHFHRCAKGDCLAFETTRSGQIRGRALIRIESLRTWRYILNNADKY